MHTIFYRILFNYNNYKYIENKKTFSFNYNYFLYLYVSAVLVFFFCFIFLHILCMYNNTCDFYYVTVFNVKHMVNCH